VRNEFRHVERLRGTCMKCMKCFPGGETQFVGNTMNNCRILYGRYAANFHI